MRQRYEKFRLCGYDSAPVPVKEIPSIHPYISLMLSLAMLEFLALVWKGIASRRGVDETGVALAHDHVTL